MFHTIAVLAVALSALRDKKFARLSMSSWLIGTLLFSGSFIRPRFRSKQCNRVDYAYWRNFIFNRMD